MDQRGDEIHTSETDASGASKEGVVRWVLLIGTLLAVVFLSIIWMTGALTQDEEDSYQNVDREILSQQADEADAGEPITPAIDTDTGSSAAPAEPEVQATPGDAPAGDPTNDAQ